MSDWLDEEYRIDEEEYADVDNELKSTDESHHYDARRRLEMLLEEKQLLDDLDDYH